MKEKDFTLTSSQKELKVKIENFLNSEERVFLLTGKPGVGKTTMTKIVLSSHIQADKDSGAKGRNINVAGISLSHQAKFVLGEHIPRVFTFAKAYGMKEKIDEDTGKRSFVIDKYNKDVCIGDCSIPVFVHDEVSQYTKDMLDIVFERTSMFSKIILMGDKAQLPPIDPENKLGRDADSPVFDLDIPKECKHELTERVRQAKDNPILELSDVIREEIFGSQDVKKVLSIISNPKMKDNIGYSFVKYSELLNHIEGKDYLKTCLIAYRNKTIRRFNDTIRNHVLKNPDDIIVEGDIVCMTDNYYKMDDLGYPLYVLYNSETFKLNKVYTNVVKYTTDEHTYRIDCYVANIEGKHGQFICPTETGIVEYERALKQIADSCRAYKMKWDVFWKFKDHFCKYTYGYAITCYKAQGSTYDSVYLDINDVLLTGPLTPKRKLQTIYTAITRARNDVYFLKSG